MIPILSVLFCFALPASGIWRLQAGKPLKRPYLLAAGSMACCGIAMLQELFTIKRRVFGGDVGGIQDTIDAVLTLCIVLLVVAVLLNLLFLWLVFELAGKDAAGNNDPALPLSAPETLVPSVCGTEASGSAALCCEAAPAVPLQPHQPVEGGCAG